MTEGWQMSLRRAELFFRYCMRYKIPLDAEIRKAILRRIAAKGHAKYLRDVDEALQGKKVIGFKPKGAN